MSRASRPAFGYVFKELMLLSLGVYLSLIWLWHFHSSLGRLMLNNQRWWCPDKAQGHREYFPSRIHWFGFRTHKYWLTTVRRGLITMEGFSPVLCSLFPPQECIIQHQHKKNDHSPKSKKFVTIVRHALCFFLCLLIVGDPIFCAQKGQRFSVSGVKKERMASGGITLLSLSCDNGA